MWSLVAYVVTPVANSPPSMLCTQHSSSSVCLYNHRHAVTQLSSHTSLRLHHNSHCSRITSVVTSAVKAGSVVYVLGSSACWP